MDCVDASTCLGTLNWGVGELYSERNFPAATKASMSALIADLTAAFRARLVQLDWMSASTKAEALKKLDTFTIKVGYPDTPRDYSSVVIRRDDLLGNVRRAATANWAFYSHRSKGPVDKSDWLMTPQTNNATTARFAISSSRPRSCRPQFAIPTPIRRSITERSAG